jgi:hypothetical protein
MLRVAAAQSSRREAFAPREAVSSRRKQPEQLPRERLLTSKGGSIVAPEVGDGLEVRLPSLVHFRFAHLDILFHDTVLSATRSI